MSDNQTFWLVWNPNGRAPSCRHWSEAEARIEAERLSGCSPGSKFYVLRATTVSCIEIVRPPVTTMVLVDDISDVVS